MDKKIKKRCDKTMQDFGQDSRYVNIRLAAIYIFAVIIFTIFISWIVLAKTIPSTIDENISGNVIVQLAKVPQVSHDSQIVVLIGAIISVLVLISLIVFLIRLKSD